MGYRWICSDGVHHALGHCPRTAYMRWRLQARGKAHSWQDDPEFRGRMLNPREYLIARGVIQR